MLTIKIKWIANDGWRALLDYAKEHDLGWRLENDDDFFEAWADDGGMSRGDPINVPSHFTFQGELAPHLKAIETLVMQHVEYTPISQRVYQKRQKDLI